MKASDIAVELEAACVLLEEAASGLRWDDSWTHPMRLPPYVRETSARAACVILEDLHTALVGHANAPHETMSCGA